MKIEKVQNHFERQVHIIVVSVRRKIVYRSDYIDIDVGVHRHDVWQIAQHSCGRLERVCEWQMEIECKLNEMTKCAHRAMNKNVIRKCNFKLTCKVMNGAVHS